jgi:hypothetical protein
LTIIYQYLGEVTEEQTYDGGGVSSLSTVNWGATSALGVSIE